MEILFYGWGSTASRQEPLRGGTLLFATKFPEIPGTHKKRDVSVLEVVHLKLVRGKPFCKL